MNIRARGTDRMLDVLDFIMLQPQPQTRNAIAAALGAPRSTVYGIIDILQARGFLDQVGADGLVVPGRRCGLLGLAYDRSAPLVRQARDIIGELAVATGEVAELDVLQDWKQLILISRSGRGHIYRGAAEGSLFPLPGTASARFLLEQIDLETIRRSVPAADFVVPTGFASSPEHLHAEIEVARKQGYWITRGLVDPYVTCITAPVRNREGRCLAVVCLVVPLPEIDRRETQYVTATLEAAARLSACCALLRNPGF